MCPVVAEALCWPFRWHIWYPMQARQLLSHSSRRDKAEMTVPWLKDGEMLVCEVPPGQYWLRTGRGAQRGWRISSLEMFSSLPDMGLGTLLWVSLPEQRLGQMDPEVSSNLNHSVFHDNLSQETAAFPAEPCELLMSSKKYLPSTNLACASCYFFPGWWQCTHLVLPGSLLLGYHARISTHNVWAMFKH